MKHLSITRVVEYHVKSTNVPAYKVLLFIASGRHKWPVELEHTHSLARAFASRYINLWGGRRLSPKIRQLALLDMSE